MTDARSTDYSNDYGMNDADQALYVTRPSLPPFDEYAGEIASLWESHIVTNMGAKHELFQQRLREVLHVDGCILFANGHSALEASLEALKLEGEAITTPFTFPSTTHAIVRAGLTPVMCDVRIEDGTLDPAFIESLITSRTAAIVPVHIYGNPCDTIAIERIAKRHGLKVIYDAAHAFGEVANGRPLASFGDASVFSFHATKVFNSIEGGAVCFNGNQEFQRRLELLRNFGIADAEHVEAIGFNAKMSELHAAIGLCNLRHHSDRVALRKHALAQYRKRLSGCAGLRFLSCAGAESENAKQDFTSNYAYCAVVIEPAFGMGRDELCAVLAEQNIHARKYFYPCTNTYPCYEGMLNPSETPVAQMLSERVICLPLFSEMGTQAVNRVCDALLTARQRGGCT